MKGLFTAANSGTYMVKAIAKIVTPFVQYPLPDTENSATKYEDMVFDFGTNPVAASASAPRSVVQMLDSYRCLCYFG